MQKYLSFIMYYGNALLLFTRTLHCLHVNYIVHKHFDRSLHVGSLDPTCVQNFRPVPLTVFEIQGFNLKNENDNKKKNWRNGLFAISPMLVVKILTKS